MNPLISVVMPAYNAEKYIAEAIESILNQTVRDFEFIIINDGSTDETLKIIKSFMLKDNRIILIDRENKGVSQSANDAIDMMTGEYMARMDADDVSLSNRFESQLKWMSKSKSEVCGAGIKTFGSCFFKVIKYYEDDASIKSQLLFGSAFAQPTMMIKAHLMKENRYNSDMNYAEDYDLWVRLALKGVKMTNTPEVLLNYRMHNAQATKTGVEKLLKVRNQIANTYWKELGLALNIENIIHVNKPQDFEEVVEVLDNADLLTDVAISELWKLALNSCHLGIPIWRHYVALKKVNKISVKSFVLLSFCIVANRHLPRSIKLLLEMSCPGVKH